MPPEERVKMSYVTLDRICQEEAEELFRSWLDADPGWGWAWIGW